MNVICKCGGASDMIDFIERANLKEGKWTSFSIARCHDCGGVKGIPRYNFELFLKEGVREELKELVDNYLADDPSVRIPPILKVIDGGKQ